MRCTIFESCVLALFFGAAQAATPPPAQPIPANQTPVTLEIRLKGAPTATDPSPTIRLFRWNVGDALNYNYTIHCWNTTSICPVVHGVTIRVIRPVWGVNLNVTRFTGLCNTTECTLPAFTPLQAKPGESYFFDYNRITAQWNSTPKIVTNAAP